MYRVIYIHARILHWRARFQKLQSTHIIHLQAYFNSAWNPRIGERGNDVGPLPATSNRMAPSYLDTYNDIIVYNIYVCLQRSIIGTYLQYILCVYYYIIIIIIVYIKRRHERAIRYNMPYNNKYVYNSI